MHCVSMGNQRDALCSYSVGLCLDAVMSGRIGVHLATDKAVNVFMYGYIVVGDSNVKS